LLHGAHFVHGDLAVVMSSSIKQSFTSVRGRERSNEICLAQEISNSVN
jgi:hypothetical protein